MWKDGRSLEPDYKLTMQSVRRSLKKGLGGKFIIKEWEHLKKKFYCSCAICKKPEGKIKLTVDHKIPISKWNEWIKKHPEIKYKCNDIENIQPLCFSCNASKNNKIKQEVLCV